MNFVLNCHTKNVLQFFFFFDATYVLKLSAQKCWQLNIKV